MATIRSSVPATTSLPSASSCPRTSTATRRASRTSASGPRATDSLDSTTGLTEPDRVLGATLAAIRRYGVAEVRAALSGIERYYQPLDVVLAIDCWVAEVLDRATFWRVADGPLRGGIRTDAAVA